MCRYNNNFIINNNKSNSYIFRKQDITSYNNRQTNVSEIRERYFATLNILSGKFITTVKRDKIILTGFYFIPGDLKDNSSKLINGKNFVKKNYLKKIQKLQQNNKVLAQLGINENQINNLGLILTKLYNRPVELHLNKVKYPYIDSTILAKYVRLLSEKYNFKRIKKTLFRNVPLTNYKIRLRNKNLISYITGLKVEISGRLITERSRPRQTVSTAKVGTFIKYNNKTILDYGSHTFKNANGALTVKIWLNQQISG